MNIRTGVFHRLDRSTMATDSTAFAAAIALGLASRLIVAESINAILYVVRTGCQWRMLPRKLSEVEYCLRNFLEMEK